MKQKQNQQGFIMVMLLSVIIIMTIMGVSLTLLISSNVGRAVTNEESQRALNASEAGINYYLWHLSHNPTDFKDGKTTPATPDPVLGYGPYTHDYIDGNSEKKATYTLWIKPQGNGSSIATVRSIGKSFGGSSRPSIRTVDAKVGAPSYASYGLIADTAVWFGNTETSSGPIHSNQGIRMDGASDSDVTSARATYTPSGSVGGDGSSKAGVWCSLSVTTPVNCNTRSKVDWRYPVPAIDFNQLSGDLCNIKKAAFAAQTATASLATGASPCNQVPTTRTPSYIPQVSSTGSYSATKGYLITLNNNNTYDLSSVSAVNDTLTPYTSALTRTSIATGVAVPINGVIFVEDNVWIRSATTYPNRVTIASGRLAQAANKTNITIAGNLLYTAKDGTAAIGLIAEGSFYIAPYAIPATGNFNFEVDAAVVAQSGDAIYAGPYYNSNNTKCTRGWVGVSQKFLFYGSVATRGTWTWLWSLGSGTCADAASSGGTLYSGILNNQTSYDYNLLYAPPPYFPITSTYNILEWKEVVTTP